MRYFILLIAMLSLASLALADVTLNVNASNGQSISGEHSFRVTAQSDGLVTSVEFYVDGILRGTDSSTPYTFTIDTLLEGEGPIEVAFAAYDSLGASARVTLNLTVNNGLDQGIDHFLDLAGEALVDSRWDDALEYARLAQRIDGDNTRVKMVLARANFGKGVYDVAQKYTEEILDEDPESTEALELLSAIMLNSAYRGAMLSSDREATLDLMRDAFRAAIESRKSAIDNQIESLGPVTDANVLAHVDLLTRAGRYSLAIDQLNPRFLQNSVDSAIANRLIYNQMRAGRFEAAQRTMRDHDRLADLDGYGFALKASIAQYFGDRREASNAERDALLEDPGNLGVRTAQAYMALLRRDVRVLGDLSAALLRDAANRTEANYYLSSAYYLAGQNDPSREQFERAMLSEPLNYDMLVERGNQVLSFSFRQGATDDDVEFQRDLAQLYFESALVAKPESFEALTGLSLLHSIQGNTEDAVATGRAATAAGPEYAAAFYAYSAALTLARDHGQAKDAMDKAEALDQANLRGRSAPTARTAWTYSWRYGRMPLITPPGV